VFVWAQLLGGTAFDMSNDMGYGFHDSMGEASGGGGRLTMDVHYSYSSARHELTFPKCM